MALWREVELVGSHDQCTDQMMQKMSSVISWRSPDFMLELRWSPTTILHILVFSSVNWRWTVMSSQVMSFVFCQCSWGQIGDELQKEQIEDIKGRLFLLNLNLYFFLGMGIRVYGSGWDAMFAKGHCQLDLFNFLFRKLEPVYSWIKTRFEIIWITISISTGMWVNSTILTF